MNFEYETQNLVLKVLHPNYASCVLQFYENNRDFLEPFEPARQPGFYTLEFQRANLSYEYSAFLKSTYLRMWLFQKEDFSVPVGTVCFSNFLQGAFCRCMVGYKTSQDHLCKGYMSEALSFLLPLVCQDYHFHRIEAYVMPSNAPSIGLLEKLGFVQEGLLHQYANIHGEWKDHYLYTYFAASSSDTSKIQ